MSDENVMVSVRLPAAMMAALRAQAKADGVRVSDLIRSGIVQMLPAATWRCEHVSISVGGAGRLLSASACCKLQPVYS